MPRLETLERKRGKRVRKRKYHYGKYERLKAKGRKVRARYQLRKFRQQKKAIKKLDRLIATEKARLEALTPKSGTGPWGGSESIIVNEVTPFIERRTGVTRTSGKRTETYGNPGSDHHVSQTTASAGDYPLVNDYATGRALASHLGGSWSSDYGSFYIVRAGKRFRVQIIAGTHGTGPHLHVGVRLA